MADQDRLAGFQKILATMDRNGAAGLPVSKADYAWLVAEVERLRGLLALLEWTGALAGQARCPVCKGLRLASGQGAHQPGCWLAAELDRTQKGVPPSP